MTSSLVRFDAEAAQTIADLAQRIARTDVVPAAYRGKPEAVLAVMLYGQELGLGLMQSLNMIQSIQGTVGLKPEGMRALVHQAGHELWFEEKTNERVVICGRRSNWPEHRIERVVWTMEDARQADLLRNAAWKKYPRAMLIARATSELCRTVFSDVTAGLAYAEDELEEMAPQAPRRQAQPKIEEAPTPPPVAALPSADESQGGEAPAEPAEAGDEEPAAPAPARSAKAGGAAKRPRKEAVDPASTESQGPSSEVTSTIGTATEEGGTSDEPPSSNGLGTAYFRSLHGDCRKLIDEKFSGELDAHLLAEAAVRLVAGHDDGAAIDRRQGNQVARTLARIARGELEPVSAFDDEGTERYDLVESAAGAA